METVGYIPEEKPEDGAKASAKKADGKNGGNKPQEDGAKADTANGDNKPAADGKK